MTSNPQQRLYKYRTFSKHTEDIIKNSSLYFSPIADLNDPFDCKLPFRQQYEEFEINECAERHAHSNKKRTNHTNYTTEQYLDRFSKNGGFTQYKIKITEDLIKGIGVLSFSTKPDNILMWSHYSDSHKGLVFEFEFSNDSEHFRSPCPVTYQSNPPLLSYAADFTNEAPKLLLTKTIDREYESEVRMINFEQQGTKQFNKHELKRIIFGAKATNTDMNEIMHLCQKNGFENISFSKAQLIDETSTLKFILIPQNSSN